jgi:hypothetical protein
MCCTINQILSMAWHLLSCTGCMMVRCTVKLINYLCVSIYLFPWSIFTTPRPDFVLLALRCIRVLHLLFRWQ